MADYARKAALIQDGTMISQVKKIHKSEYAHYALLTTGELIDAPYDGDTAFGMRRIWECDDDFKEAERIVDAQNHRTWRLKDRVSDIVQNYSKPTFVTLTFSDEVFERTSKETRRRYVRRFLVSQSGKKSPYVANIDFGKEKGREHYHAVCSFEVDPWAWKYGILDVERIRKSSKPIVLAKYVSKLTNHAIKETARRSALIYSRN